METDGNPPLYSGGSFLCGNTLRGRAGAPDGGVRRTGRGRSDGGTRARRNEERAAERAALQETGRAFFCEQRALPSEAPSVITGAGGGAHRRAPCGWRFRDGTFRAYAGPFSVKERRFRWKRRSVSAGRAGGMEAGNYRAEILLRIVHRPHSASAAAARPTAANTTGSPVSGFVRR